MKRAQRTDFGVPGNRNFSANARYHPLTGEEISREEWDFVREEIAREAKAAREEAVEEDWAAEMDNRGILFAGALPRIRSEKVALECGCKYKKKFTANLYQLARLERDRVCCPRCSDTAPVARLHKLVEQKNAQLLTPYNKASEKVTIKCERGHVFEALPANLTRKGGGSWCPRCANGPGTGEHKMREVLAERGLVLTNYGPVNSYPKKAYRMWDGEERWGYHSQIMDSPPTYPDIRGPKKVRTFYDDTTMRAFVIVGEVPPLLPKAVWDVVRKDDFEVVGTAQNMQKAKGMFKEAIEADNAIGDYHLLNVLHNPLWVSPGEYAWGKIGEFHGTLVPTEKED